MSLFPPPTTASPQSLANDGVLDMETQPLIQRTATADDTKQETDTQPPIPTASPPQSSPRLLASPEYSPRSGEGPIHLAPDHTEETQAPSSRLHLWPTTGRFAIPDSVRIIARDLGPEDRGILDDMRRGALILVTTPIAFTGMALYSCGMIIEGVALLLKGLGSMGGRVLMRRRQRSQATQSQAANPLWV